MHPRDMFLSEDGANNMSSVDQEFALEWYRRGICAGEANLRSELVLHEEHEKRMEEWRIKGEKLLERKGINFLFLVGCWWADRPWRKREN